MKKFIYIFIAATILSCTKSEVAYEPTHEIGFTAAAGNITKAVVDGTSYPTTLNLCVFAWTTDYGDRDTEITPNYIDKGEFRHKSVAGIDIPVWGGTKPYYWPNTHKLHFAGCSISGNLDNLETSYVIEGPQPEYNCYTNEFSIANYSPLYDTAEDANDLMWFSSAEYNSAAESGYGKDTPYVQVNMYHTCSWITFLVKGDQTTAGRYSITDIWMSEIDLTADVKCKTITSEGKTIPSITWSNNTDKENTSPNGGTEYRNIYINNSLTGSLTLTQNPLNIETGTVYPSTGNAEGNIVIIPQVPGKLNIKYGYTSSTGTAIVETVNDIDLKITTDPEDEDNKWEPGKHYIYTITIKANEIVIAPTPSLWTSGNSNVTVE